MAWTPLTNLAHARLWEHINNLATQLAADLATAIGAERRKFAGTEVAIVGTNPPANTVVVEQIQTSTITVSGGGGGAALTFPTPFTNGVCGVNASVISSSSGTAAQLVPYPSAYAKTGWYWIVQSSNGVNAADGVTVKVSVRSWGW